MTHERILKDPAEIGSFLADLELDLDGLIEVVRYADGERALCSANDIKGWPLIILNAKAVRALRDRFAGDRWISDETDNQGGILNPHLKVRIIPCNFDENAGNLLKTPTNRTEKGSASRRKAMCNATAWLPELDAPSSEPEDEIVTYVLGIYSEEGEPLRAELSRPDGFSSGIYRKFTHRIVLLDGTEDPLSGRPSDSDRDGPTEIIDIEIKRK